MKSTRTNTPFRLPKHRVHTTLLLTLPMLALSACSAATPSRSNTPERIAAPATASSYPSTYVAPAVPPTLIRGATVLIGDGQRLEGADVLLRNGVIAEIGSELSAPADSQIIDARGKWLTPGLIDVHSHLGVYPAPGVEAHADGNEATAPSTAQVWAEHSIWPQDPGFETALQGGVTTLHVLPGSANLFGGRSVTVKNVSSVTYQGMKFPDAPHGLKMACGENPKRVYGNRRTAPSTRMGNVAGWRAQWIEAQEYARDHQQYAERIAKGSGANNPMLRPPKRDLRLETLAAVLQGDILVQHHCYRADEMAIVLDLAREFDYRVTAFHHATEAYKIANLLAEREVCAAVWADWWGFKMESYDAIPENMILVDAAPKGCAIVHSDSDEGIQRLNQEAAKSMAFAKRMGIDITPEHAIRWLTGNAARALGITQRTGTLHQGKMADVVIWNQNPFSVDALAEKVFIDGVLRFDRGQPAVLPESDFLLGQPATHAASGPLAADSLLIRNATLYTAAANETEPRRNTDVLIENGVVTQIGTNLPIRAAVAVIDAEGRAVTPGVFGGLGRVGLEEIGLEQTTGDYAQRLGQMRPEFDVTLAFNPEAMSLGVHLKNGITFSVLAPSASRGGSMVAGLGAATGLDGSLATGPRVMFVDLGGDANDLSGGSRAAQFMLLRQAFVEARAPNLVLVHDERLLSPAGRQVLVDFIKNQGVFVFDVDRTIDIQRAIDFARSEGIRAVIQGGAEAWRLAPTLAAAGIPVIIDPLENLPYSFDSLGATLQNAARLRQAGVTVAISLRSAQVQSAGKTRQAAGNAVAHGLPWIEGLAAITRVPAEIFGVADRFGSIGIGRKADLVLWSGDPLDVASLPDLVISNGRQQPLQSRHSALRDRHYERVQQGLAR